MNDSEPQFVGPQKLLLVKGRAGLGNRMLCALTGLLYAQLSGRRIIIDWSDDVYSDDRSNAFPRYFRCDRAQALAAIPTTDSVRPAEWRGKLRLSAKLMHRAVDPASVKAPDSFRRFSVDLRRIDYPEDVLVMWAYIEQIDELRRHFSGAFAPLRGQGTKRILRDLLRTNLVLQPAIRQRVDAIKAQWPSAPMIGVHVRYLDKRSRLAPIRRRLNRLLKQAPGAAIFLATDNAQIQETFQREHPCVLATRKWFPTSGNSMHMNPECQNRLENGVEALLDIYLLAECDYLIIDESSSFSYIAALLTDAPARRVYNVAAGRWVPPRLRRMIWLALLRSRQMLRRSEEAIEG